MRLGVDVGGTFTDLLLHDEKGRKTYQAKTPSTPEDQSIGVAAGVKLICEKAGISPSDVDVILHGTTVATNAVLEGKGARVGLLNRGSGHILLAFASPKERTFMLEEREQVPGEEIPPDFERRLETIRTNGYEMMESFQTRGVINISAPVLGPNGTAIAALTCPFIHRIDPSGSLEVPDAVELVKQAGRELSRMSGGIEESAEG